MAVYKIFPTKDATLYSQYNDMNTGLDEIIEASTTIQETKPQVSRYLIHFSDTEITNAFARFDQATKDYDIFLKNYTAVVTGLNLDQKLLPDSLSLAREKKPYDENYNIEEFLMEFETSMSQSQIDFANHLIQVFVELDNHDNIYPHIAR